MPGGIEGEKMSVTIAELDERILREKRLAALEMQTETWADGISEGIEPEILAMAGMETILSRLIADCGPEAAGELLETVRRNFENGHFHAIRFRN